MLDIVKTKFVIDVHDLVDAMGEIEGLSSHDIFSEFQDMHCYGGGNESYIEIREDYFFESCMISQKRMLSSMICLKRKS